MGAAESSAQGESSSSVAALVAAPEAPGNAVVSSGGAEIVLSPLDNLLPAKLDPSIVAKDDIVRALFCATAAYIQSTGGVSDYLESNIRQGPPWEHALGAFQKILVSRRGTPVRNSFIVAYTADAVYIAFRGTTHESFRDTLASANMLGRQHSIGYVHAGYADRARVMDHVSLDSLREMSNGNGRRRVIFCGHSLGGSVSHVVLLQYLISAVLPLEKTKDGPPPGSMVSIAFGAPHWCDETASKWIKDRGLSKLFVTFVNGNDPIPSLFEDLRGTLNAGFAGVSRHAYASFGKVIDQLAPWLIEDAKLGDALGFMLSLSDRTAFLSTLAPVALQAAQQGLNALRKQNDEEETFDGEVPDLEPFYCPAGIYIHLRSDDKAKSSGEPIVLMDEVSRFLFPGVKAQFTPQTLGDHYMGSYSERIVGLIQPHVQRGQAQPNGVPKPEASSSSPSSSSSGGVESKQIAIVTEAGSAPIPEVVLSTVIRRPIVTQPPPEIEVARYEVVPEQRLAVITIEGRNLFFLMTPVEVTGLGKRKSHDPEWVVIARGPNGTSLKIGLALGEGPGTVRPAQGEALTVSLQTAFGEVGRTRVTAASEVRSPGLASDMWLQSVEAMALMFEQTGPRFPLEFNRTVSLMEDIAAAAGGIERGLASRELRRLVEHGRELGAAVRALDALAPLVECVSGYLSGMWDMELKPELMNQVMNGAFVALLAGGVVLLSSGVLGVGMLTIGAEFAVGEAMLGAAAASAGAAVTGQMVGHLGLSNNCVKFTDAKKTLENLLEFVGHSYEGLAQEDCDQATLERKIVHAATQHGLNFNTRSIEDITRTILKDNNSLIAKSGSSKTVEEAIRRVKILVGVHELYDILGLNGVTFIAAVGNEDTGKSTLVQGLLERAKISSHVPNIGTDLHTNTARAYPLRDKVWLVDFPGLNSANPARRATASATWSRFGHVTQKAVLVMQFASKPSATDRELLEEVERRVAGRVLVVLNKADRYIEDIRDEPTYLRQRRLIYCDPSVGLGVESEDLLFTVLRPSSLPAVEGIPDISSIDDVARAIDAMVAPAGPSRPLMLPPPTISEIPMLPFPT